MAAAQPIYEEMDGWTERLDDVRKFSDLPATAQKYVQRIEAVIGSEVILVSVGPGPQAAASFLEIPSIGKDKASFAAAHTAYHSRFPHRTQRK